LNVRLLLNLRRIL